jgi:hypothetical protein
VIPSFSSHSEVVALSMALMWAVFAGCFAALLFYDFLRFLFSSALRLVDRFAARRSSHD